MWKQPVVQASLARCHLRHLSGESKAAITDRLCIWGAELAKQQAILEPTEHVSDTLHIELPAWTSAWSFIWDFSISSKWSASKIFEHWELLTYFLTLPSCCIFWVWGRLEVLSALKSCMYMWEDQSGHFFFFQTRVSKLVRLMNMDSKSRKEY